MLRHALETPIIPRGLEQEAVLPQAYSLSINCSYDEHLFMRLIQRLHSLEEDGRPIPVAVIGAGQMGAGVARQIAAVPGLRLAGVCDLVPERAASAVQDAGGAAADITSPDDVARVARDRRVAVTGRAEWLVDSDIIGAVIDATGDPEAAARLALLAIARKRPFVTMTVEADVTVGAILAQRAREAGTVYTVAAGDEPSVLCDMVDSARLMGLEVVCAGKGKNNRLERAATPKSVAVEAARRGMSPRMLAAFVDGTKTMIEMAALANATGLTLDRPGMHGPQADLRDLLRIFVPESDGGILTRRGVVEYAIGDVAPGVFVVAFAAHPGARQDLAYLRMGDGPYYLLYRPYHLTSFEVPLSVARAVFYGETLMAPAGLPRAECVAVAKRDLAAGEVLDGIGGETVYGMADTYERARASEAVPIGVIDRARLSAGVAQGTVLAARDVVLDERQTVVQLRRAQEAAAVEGVQR